MMAPNSAERLLLRVSPFNGESWVSYRHRIAAYNYPDAPRLVGRLFHDWCHRQGKTDVLNLPQHADSILWLAKLCWLTPIQLLGMSFHRFASPMTPLRQAMPTVKIGSYTIPRLVSRVSSQILTSETSRYCPHCLASSPYQRWLWSANLVTMCLQHHCLLKDVCPQCQKPITVAEVISAYCQTCDANLATAPTGELCHDELGIQAQVQIQTWLNGPLQLRVGEGLSSPRAAYQLLHDVVVLLAQRQLETFHHKVPRFYVPQTQADLSALGHHCRVTTAFKVLQAWPNNFHAFLDAFREVARDDLWSLPASLGGLYRRLQSDWEHPDFEAVQLAFDAYFIQQFGQSFHIRKSRLYQQRPQLQAQMPWLSYTEAAKILELKPKDLTPLGRLHLLKRELADDQEHWLFERTSVETFKVLADRWLALDDLPERFGIPPAFVPLLFRSVLEEQDGRWGTRQKHPWLIACKLVAVVTWVQKPPARTVSLEAALMSVLHEGGDIATELDRYLTGERPVYYLMSSPRQWQHYFVPNVAEPEEIAPRIPLAYRWE